MATDTSKITTAANDLGDGLAKGGTAAKTLGAEIVNAIKSLDTRLTTLETASPPGTGGPPDPGIPPDTNTYGKVTNFNAANDAYIKVDGVDCQIQNSNKSWSIKNPDQYSLRFELHSKDCWSTSGWNDATQNNGAERTEMYWTPRYSHNTGQILTNEFEFTLEPGPTNTAPWMVFSQTHGDPGQGSPPYELMMDGEKLKVTIGYKKPGQGSVTYKTVWRDENPIQRGHKYQFKVELKFDLNAGYCKAWRDGTQIVNSAGPIGYDGDRYYWKQGIYRGPAPETISAVFSHTHITSVP